MSEMMATIAERDRQISDLQKRVQNVKHDYDEREEKMLTRFCLILNEKKEIIAALKEGRAIPKRTQNQKEIQKQINQIETKTKAFLSEAI